MHHFDSHGETRHLWGRKNKKHLVDSVLFALFHMDALHLSMMIRRHLKGAEPCNQLPITAMVMNMTDISTTSFSFGDTEVVTAIWTFY